MRRIIKSIDLSERALGLQQKDFVFSTNPTKDDLKRAEVEGKILIVYSKNPKKCLEFRERLGESVNLIIWLDQSPIKMIDGRELDFEEFFLGPYLEMFRKNMLGKK